MSILISLPLQSIQKTLNTSAPCTTDSQKKNWVEAEQDCKRGNYDGLVSMRTEGEWVYFKRMTTNREQKGALQKPRWFIGLRYFSQKWCWANDTKACINQTTNKTGYWRWSGGEPNHLNTEHCVEMYNGGEYNNINCSERFGHTGFICEKKVGM